MPGLRLGAPFKSHHSGMETKEVQFPAGIENLFKSHHSGMETPAPAGNLLNPGALNRTIVGWKQGPAGGGADIATAL